MQIPLNLDHSTSFALEDFIVSQSNQIAYGTVRSWPDWSYHVAALVGPEAAGKSHLALGWGQLSEAAVYQGCEISKIKFDQSLSNLIIEDILNFKNNRK